MEFRTTQSIDLYDSPACARLATQVGANRHFKIMPATDPDQKTNSIAVCTAADDYYAWLKPSDLKWLAVAPNPYKYHAIAESDIRTGIEKVLQFIKSAQTKPNIYLWGGTLGPNYDCSGLMQTAFNSIGVWIPRDAYQQEDFLEPIPMVALELGDLVFFGTPKKAAHVGLYLGEGRYIHSSGLKGRNGIGIDSLVDLTDPVSQAYARQLRGFGRVVASYQPTGNPYVLKRDPLRSLK